MPTLPVALPSLMLTDAPRPPMVQDVLVLLKLKVKPLNNLIRYTFLKTEAHKLEVLV